MGVPRSRKAHVGDKAHSSEAHTSALRFVSSVVPQRGEFPRVVAGSLPTLVNGQGPPLAQI